MNNVKHIFVGYLSVDVSSFISGRKHDIISLRMAMYRHTWQSMLSVG